MDFQLITTTNKARKETTVSAHDSKGVHICSETQAGIGARVTAELTKQVRSYAHTILRAEQARPAHRLFDRPSLPVPSLAPVLQPA